MRLTRIEVESFRCFGRTAFDLMHPTERSPLDVVLLVGPNGSGKTALLRAIARFFTSLNPVYDGGAFEPSDVRKGEDEASIAVSFTDCVEDGSRRDVELLGRLFRAPHSHRTRSDDPVLDWLPDSLMRRILSLGDEPREVEVMLKPGFYVLRASPDAGAWMRAVDAPTGSAGLIVAFSASRALAPAGVSGPHRSRGLGHRCERALKPLRGARDASSRARDLAQWIVNIDFRRAKAKADRGHDLPVWDALRRGLDTMLAPYTFQGVDDDFRVLFRTPRGVLTLDDLSQGFSSVFLIVAELLFRASLAARRPEDLFEQEIVCLIDEIDAHLHPRWQETIIAGLRSLFPRLQIIATTHSPFVVSSVDPCNVFRLEEI